jgi:hypothetical protein
MRQPTALPFTLKRSNEVFSGAGMTTTTETVHGLLRLTAENLSIQWRLARKTDHLGGEIRTDEELEAVRQVTIPLSGISGASVRRRWWEWPGGFRLELTAYDLQAFEEAAGQAGLKMAHPAQLILKVNRRDRLAAEEFAAELALVVAERLLGEGSGEPLPPDEAGDPPDLLEKPRTEE